MEIKIDNSRHTLQDDDVISLRDLQLYDQTATSSTRSSSRASSGHELFEFFPNLPSPTATGHDVIFCGKVISNSDRMLVGSSSVRLPDRRTEHVIPMRSVSNRDLGSPRHGFRISTSGKKVNVKSKSKRRMFMFGPVKFMPLPEMEMSSMKERQLSRAPSSMFPVAEGGDVAKTVTGGTDKNKRVKSRARLDFVLACLRI